MPFPRSSTHSHFHRASYASRLAGEGIEALTPQVYCKGATRPWRYRPLSPAPYLQQPVCLKGQVSRLAPFLVPAFHHASRARICRRDRRAVPSGNTPLTDHRRPGNWPDAAKTSSLRPPHRHIPTPSCTTERLNVSLSDRP